MSESSISQALSSAQARYTDLAKRDILTALSQFKDLTVAHDMFTFNDGSRRPVTSLSGTIPVAYRGSTYNIPVCLYLLDTHPYHPPMCFVRPTPDMTIKPSQYVDHTGRIYMPYLHEWKHPSSDLSGLLQVMAIIFGDNCPVFSKQAGSTANPPQPTGYNPYGNPAAGGTPYPSGNNWMPMPSASPGSGGTGYNYPPKQPPYPSYPSSTQSYTPYTSSSGGSSPYPSYPAGNYPSAQPSYPGSRNPYPPSTTNNSYPQGYSPVVEDKIRRRLRENVGGVNAELQSIRKTQDDLRRGEQKLKAMLDKLEQEQSKMDSSIVTYTQKTDEIDRVLKAMPTDGELKIDEAIDTTAPLYRQLLNAFAEDSAIEDAVYSLGEALRDHKIELDAYLKQVRRLSRQQFMLRATMIKCRKKAGLEV